MKRPKLNSESGLSILEVLIAMIILSLSLLMLLNMAMVALDGNDWSNKTTTATQLLQEKLEQLRATNMPTSGQDTTAAFTRTWTVSTAANHLRRIDIDVAWADLRNQTKNNTLTAYIKTDSL